MDFEISVIANKRELNELACGVVVFDGTKYDYSKTTSHLDEIKQVLETPIEVPDGYVASDGYGEHTVDKRKYDPFTFGHLCMVTNFRRADGLYLACDIDHLLHELNDQYIKQK